MKRTRGDAVRIARTGGANILVLLAASASLLAVSPRSAEAQTLPARPLLAQAVAPGAPAADPQSPQQARQAAATPTAQGPVQLVEGRISALHKDLRITPAQEPQFDAYAQAMRGNAQAMQVLFEEHAKTAEQDAVGRLRWYARLAAAHAEAVGKLVPVFETLYQSLTDKQKKEADAVFKQLQQRRAARRTERTQ